jgi:hypothetical protein
LNGGIVIVARAVEVDDKRKVLILKRPSIINGSQTQGELRKYYDAPHGEDFFEPSIKYELIVTTDNDLIAEISTSRNFRNDVRAISIAGRRGQLDELEVAVQRVIPDAKLRKSETDLTADDEFLDTEKLIQVLFALMPRTLFDALEMDATNKVFAYSQKTRCLKSSSDCRGAAGRAAGRHLSLLPRHGWAGVEAVRKMEKPPAVSWNEVAIY